MNWPFWLELMVRSSVLLMAGEALRRASKRGTAAFRHRLVLWVFAMLVMLPVLSVLFPEIPIFFWRTAHELRGHVTAEEVSSRMLGAPAKPSLNWPLAIWLSGVVVACVPLIVGGLSAWRMVLRATPLESAALRSLNDRVSRGMAVLVSSELRVPITCGLLRPRIVLPGIARDWSATRLEAVLLHELAHVRRRDVATQFFVHLVTALWWFQPLAWVLRGKLRAESELACDAEALRSGFRPSEYAAELLGVAKSAGWDWRLSSSAIGMVRRGDLEERLRAVLQPGAGLLQGKKLYVVGLVLGAVWIAASAVSVRASDSDTQGGYMKRAFISALLTSAGLSAATVSGYIHDGNGTALADAKVSIYTPNNSAKQETVTGADGKFSFSGSEGGQYILRVEKPGFASIFHEFDMKADGKMEREFTMASEGGALTPDKAIGSTGDQPKRIRVGGQVAQSNLLTKVQPVYPAAAKKAGTQGTVEIETTISKDGVPVDLRVTSSPSDDLSESALEAVGQWRYRPTLLNGEPVEIVTVVVVNYTLTQ